MIVYATPKVITKYSIRLPNEVSAANAHRVKEVLTRDTGDALHEWGLNLFDFIGKNCLVIMNYATKFALFLFDVNKDHIQNLGNIIAHHLLELYSGDKEMDEGLHRMFEENPYLVFAPMRNRSIAAHFNARIRELYSYMRIYEYIDYKNILHTRQINYNINFTFDCKYNIDGKETFRKPGVCFRNLILSRYTDR